MYAKFNLGLGDNDSYFDEYVGIGRNLYEDTKIKVESDLEKFENADGSLNASEIIENWFPNIKANIFLSHAHKNSDLAIGLGGWLEEKFGLTPFIDSMVWGYADRLLKQIDNKYCKNSYEKTYSYPMRNRSTTHVHLMLSTALMNMVNHCECIIFINTPESFEPTDYFEDKGNTESPWIYSEIAMTRLLKQRSLPRGRERQIMFDSAEASREAFESVSESFPDFKYKTALDHLTQINFNDLKSWEKSNKRGVSALDVLYKMKGIRYEP